MCRNIRRLYNIEPPTNDDEIRDAALQFVRKVSGFRKPSRNNAEAFDIAIGDISEAVHNLLDTLVTSAPPHQRDIFSEEASSRK